MDLDDLLRCSRSAGMTVVLLTAHMAYTFSIEQLAGSAGWRAAASGCPGPKWWQRRTRPISCGNPGVEARARQASGRALAI